MNPVALNRSQKLHRLAWFLPLAAAVYLGNAWIVRHPWDALVAPNGIAPEWPVLVDVLVTVPLLYLIAFWRNGRRAWIGAGMIAATGIVIADWIVPAESRQWLDALGTLRHLVVALIVVGEGALIVGVARLIGRLSRQGGNVETAIDSAVHSTFGDAPVARLLAFEARMWFYALFASSRRPQVFAGDEHFTYHLKDGHASNQQGFIVLILIELPILHVLLTLFWHAQAAWIVTLLTVWGLCFLVGEYRASTRRPISVDGEAVYVRYGLAAEVRIPLQHIASVRPSRIPVRRRTPGVLRYCEAGDPNVCIELAPPLLLPGMFGAESSIERIYLGLDAPERFITSLRGRIGAHSGMNPGTRPV